MKNQKYRLGLTAAAATLFLAACGGGEVTFMVNPMPLGSTTPTAASTPVPTNTNTPVATNTPAPTNTDTPVPTSTDTPVPTNTPVPTSTDTPVPTSTNTPVATNTPAPTNTDTPVPTNTNTPVATNTPAPTNTDTPLPTATNTPAADSVAFTGGSATTGVFLDVVNVAATSSNGGTITYSSNTPTTCTVNSSTGAVTLDGQAAGDCTVKATSSLQGAASATRTIAITTKTLAASSCTPDIPRSGDAIVQTIEGMSNAYNSPRDLGAFSAPNNPDIRAVPTVTATYNYAAGVGGGTTLTTAATGGTQSITMYNNTGGTTANPVTTTVWLGYLPQPYPAGLLPAQTPAASMVEAYDIDASGNITTPNYWSPATTTKPGPVSDKTAYKEFYPADWQTTFAKRVTGATTAGTVLGAAVPVTIRSTGGYMNGFNFSKAGGTMNGASYKNVYYNVTATYQGRSATETLTVANGKLTYTNMCQIDYQFTRRGIVNPPAEGITAVGPVDPGAVPPLSGAYQNYVWTADISANGASVGCNQACVTLGGTNGNGDWAGTFYSHNNIPRVVKDNFTAVPTVAGATLNNGAGTVAQANSDYYENKNRAVGDVSSMNTATTGVTRLALP